jgi:hypothetical protein
MSIATLKRKTQTQYNNMSVGSKTGFSLNGTHRSQGYVGQTTLSRSLPKTIMKGNTPKGHGGCCGHYEEKPIVQSAVTSLNNPVITKLSVLGTHGMLSSRYRWINRPQPYSTVKPDTTNNLNTQEDYITRLKKKTLTAIDTCTNTKSSPSCNNYNTYFRQSICNYTKPESTYKPINSSDYITKIHESCVKDDVIPVSNIRKTPFMGGGAI